MLLSTRITLFVLGTVAVVAALLLAAADLRQDALEDRNAELELKRLEAGWEIAVTEAAGAIDLQLGALVAEGAVGAALRAKDRGLLFSLMQPAEATELAKLNAFDADGQLLYTSGDALDPRPLLGRAQVAQVLAGERAPRGARTVDAGRLMVVASVPVFAEGRVVGALAAAVPLSAALDRLEGDIGGRVFAVGREGQPLHGDRSPLWNAVKRYAGIDRGVRVFAHEDRRYQLADVAIADLAGGRAANLLVAADVTRQEQLRELWTLAYGGAIVVLVAAALGFLYVYLRRGFETLGTAVEALHDLAGGATERYVELPAGTDEIGRIAGAVTVFGGAMREVQRAAGQRERRLRRQQRFIRRQMEQLAATLEEEARQALLDELKQIEAAAQDPASAQSKGVNDELGLIALGFSRLATRVSVQQVQLLQNVRDLKEALEDKRRLISLQQELEIARTMQLSILPQEFPDLPELDIAARMEPAKEVGGDFYDVFPIGERTLAVTVADVSGKGIPAAFFMLITRTMLRAIATTSPHPGPAETMRRLNNLLAAENEQMMFVTVFHGEIDLDTGRFTYCNAGHNPPYRVAAGGTVTALEKTAGTALAVMPDLPYSEKALDLAPGDVLVMFTDGVSEAFDAAGGMYGEERLVATLGSGPVDTARAGLERMMNSVAAFAAGAEQSDDITGVVVRWRAAAGQPRNSRAASFAA